MGERRDSGPWPGSGRAALALVLAGAILGLGACGGDDDGDSSEPEGDFPIEVVETTFPERQRTSETNDLVIEVENIGEGTVPDLAITVAADSEASDSFSTISTGQNLADPNRPVWILDPKYPRLAGESKPSGLTGASTALTNTWAFGPLEPEQVETVVWRLTAVRAGEYTIEYRIAAGLEGSARAVDAAGEPVEGSIPVSVSGKPPKSRVNGKGKVVTQEP